MRELEDQSHALTNNLRSLELCEEKVSLYSLLCSSPRLPVALVTSRALCHLKPVSPAPWWADRSLCCVLSCFFMPCCVACLTASCFAATHQHRPCLCFTTKSLHVTISLQMSLALGFSSGLEEALLAQMMLAKPFPPPLSGRGGKFSKESKGVQEVR